MPFLLVVSKVPACRNKLAIRISLKPVTGIQHQNIFSLRLNQTNVVLCRQGLPMTSHLCRTQFGLTSQCPARDIFSLHVVPDRRIGPMTSAVWPPLIGGPGRFTERLRLVPGPDIVVSEVRHHPASAGGRRGPLCRPARPRRQRSARPVRQSVSFYSYLRSSSDVR